MVYNELTFRPKTRDDDRLLIACVYKDYFNIRNDSFEDVINRTDLPSFESIRRARQKLQQHHEELRGSVGME